MNKYFGLQLGVLFFFLTWVAVGLAQGRPNFIFILTDDQSYGMMGCTGNTIVSTPNLDQLASDGVLFTNAHVTSAICTPSRTSILTSQFERKHGINFNSGTSMSEEGWSNTYPVVMRKNGYYTGWIGKNHVPVGTGGYSSQLMENSFDYWYAAHGHLRFYPKESHEIFGKAKDDTQPEIIGEGMEDFLSNDQKLEGVVKFLDQRPGDKPFMLSIAFNLPHSASTSTMELRDSDDEIYRKMYRDRVLPLPTNYVAKRDIVVPKLPEHIHRAEDRQKGYDFVDTPETVRERYTRQLQSMTGIDRVVGRLRQTLKKQRLHKNTVIILTSDHGLFMGQFGLGGKALCYEVVTHVPLIVFDPLSKKRHRGRTSTALVQTIDIAPTLLSMAQIPVPDSYQGHDITPILSQKQSGTRDFLFTENLWSTHFGNPRCEAVQDFEWKYVRYYKNQNLSALKKIETAKKMGIPVSAMLYKVHDPDIALYRSYIEDPLDGEPAVYEELFHLKDDPNETTNLAINEEYRNILNNMRKVWATEIKNARGSEMPSVVRYTAESEGARKAHK